MDGRAGNPQADDVDGEFHHSLQQRRRFNSAGKMVERWVIEDEVGVLQQLGRIPRFQGQGG